MNTQTCAVNKEPGKMLICFVFDLPKQNLMPLSISSVLTHVYEDNCLICFTHGKVAIEIAKGLWKEN